MDVTKQLKQLSADTVLYGLGSVLQSFIGFLLFPIYTRLLTKEDLGSQDLVLTGVTIITYLLVLGLDSGAARHYYDKEEPEEKRAVLSTWLWFELMLSIPICVILIVLARPICAAIFNYGTLAPYFQLGVATLPFALTTRVSTLTLRLTFQAKKFSFMTVFGALVQALTAIVFVVILRLGITGVFLAMLTANVAQMLIGLGLTRQYLGWRFSRLLLRSMLAFGVPLVPASLSLWVLNYSNRYFLTQFAALSDIGLLSVGVRFSTLLTFIIAAFSTAWPPFAYSLLKDQVGAKNAYSKILTYFLLITQLALVTLTIFAREALVILATPAYEASAVLIPWLGYSSIAWGVVGIVGIGCEIAKKSYHFSISTIIGAIVTTALNLWLISRWGIIGAVIATMMGNLIALLYGYFAGQHYFFVHYEFSKVLLLIGAAAITIVISVLVDRGFYSWKPEILVFKTLLYATFLVSLFVFKIITRENIRGIRVYLTDRIRLHENCTCH
jgi:O-antigen/teichoic acid export membrane protein